MKVDAIKEMFLRSEERYRVKYANYIGDGDSKTFKAILDLNPYGAEFTVTKVSALDMEKNELERDFEIFYTKRKKLGGKGKLTDDIA